MIESDKKGKIASTIIQSNAKNLGAVGEALVASARKALGS